MGQRKVRVGILFGGKSAEHEVSVRSARNVVAALDKSKYEAVLIGIDRDGHWRLGTEGKLMLADSPSPRAESVIDSNEVMLLPRDNSEVAVMSPGNDAPLAHLDVVFPVLHGPNGEDGTVQGLLRLANIPFVGADVLGSAVGMDKDVMKRLLRDAGVPIGKFLVFTLGNKKTFNAEKVFKELGSPVFVKPANLGSSIGISKADSPAALQQAVDEAFKYDRKIVIEEFIKGREIECAVLGNENPIASIPGEIIHGSQHEFYSYEAKYLNCDGQRIEIPAQLPATVVSQVQKVAVEAYKALCCEGMGRVDFFVTDQGRVLLNEINTLPGFTNISMYPMLWEKSGVKYQELIDKLIQLALERYQQQRQLKDKPELEA